MYIYDTATAEVADMAQWRLNYITPPPPPPPHTHSAATSLQGTCSGAKKLGDLPISMLGGGVIQVVMLGGGVIQVVMLGGGVIQVVMLGEEVYK